MKRARPPAFTLVELTIVLALMAIVMGLVVVRFSWGSPRQAVIGEARRLGCLLQTYREKARVEERLYALRLDLETGGYEVLQPQERTEKAFADAPRVRSAALDPAVHFGPVMFGSRQAISPVTFFLDAKGILPAVSIEVAHRRGQKVVLKPDTLVNEVVYDER